MATANESERMLGSDSISTEATQSTLEVEWDFGVDDEGGSLSWGRLVCLDSGTNIDLSQDEVTVGRSEGALDRQ